MAANIWRHSPVYSFFRPYVDFCTRLGYSRFDIEGRENIPVQGAVIYAPNHTNTLMDALVMLRCRRGPTAFGARADLFRDPQIASILRFLRIVPMARERDGIKAVCNNFAVMDEVVDCIDHEVPFCLFPEGTHRPMHSLLPLKKGIVRIAIKAARKLEKPVYIVPVGIEYGDYYHASKHCRVKYGEPICMNEVLATCEDLPEAELYRKTLDLLRQRMSGLITYFPDDEKLAQTSEEFDRSARSNHGPVARIAAALAALPFGFLSLPMLCTEAYFSRKLKDRAWINTVRFAARLLFTVPQTLIVSSISFITLPVLPSVILTVLAPFAYSIFHLLYNVFKKA